MFEHNCYFDLFNFLAVTILLMKYSNTDAPKARKEVKLSEVKNNKGKLKQAQYLHVAEPGAAQLEPAASGNGTAACLHVAASHSARRRSTADA